MKEAKGDMLTMACDALCITTNGFIKSNGCAVMGAGIAKQVNRLVDGVDKRLGELITKEGNKVHLLTHVEQIALVSFPVKPVVETSNGKNFVSHKYFAVGTTVPGWACKADIKLIERSCHQLVELTDRMGWKRVLLPRMGCGRGELDWEDVKKVVEPLLDDRFIVCTF